MEKRQHIGSRTSPGFRRNIARPGKSFQPERIGHTAEHIAQKARIQPPVDAVGTVASTTPTPEDDVVLTRRQESLVSIAAQVMAQVPLDLDVVEKRVLPVPTTVLFNKLALSLRSLCPSAPSIDEYVHKPKFVLMLNTLPPRVSVCYHRWLLRSFASSNISDQLAVGGEQETTDPWPAPVPLKASGAVVAAWLQQYFDQCAADDKVACQVAFELGEYHFFHDDKAQGALALWTACIANHTSVGHSAAWYTLSLSLSLYLSIFISFDMSPPKKNPAPFPFQWYRQPSQTAESSWVNRPTWPAIFAQQTSFSSLNLAIGRPFCSLSSLVRTARHRSPLRASPVSGGSHDSLCISPQISRKVRPCRLILSSPSYFMTTLVQVLQVQFVFCFFLSKRKSAHSLYQNHFSLPFCHPSRFRATLSSW